MKELKDIVKAYGAATVQGKQTALATVVHLEGSAYRRPGARMLVTEDGHLTGAISGGCLEGDALRKAQNVMVQRRPMLVTYDTMDDDDAKLGVGLGCNGIISILIEPIDAGNASNPIELIKSVVADRTPAVLVTLFSLNKRNEQPGTFLLVTRAGNRFAQHDDQLFDLVQHEAALALEKKNTVTLQFSAALTGFVEFIQPAIAIHVFGAGNDAMPLVALAKVLGWETTVVDGRPGYATVARFAMADKVLVAKPGEILNILSYDEHTVAVLLTHNYNYDVQVLRQLLPLPFPYLGVLGPRKKMSRMLEELREQTGDIPGWQLSKVYGPAGTDLGAETPEEIALSIVSEIKAVVAGKKTISLRDKQEIHDREPLKIQDAQNAAV